MTQIGRLIAAVVGLSVLLVGAGCAGSAGSRQPVVIVEGAAETAAAATAYYDRQTATAAVPTLTPYPRTEGYARPTDVPSIPGDAVIATAGGQAITVDEFRSRVRFERWLALETLFQNVQIASVTPADMAAPQNAMIPTIIGVLYTLQDAEGFAESVLTMMLQERIMHQEYHDRGLEPNPALENNLWLNLIGLAPPAGGGLPEDFEAARDAFMARIAPFTAISQAELAFRMTVRSERQTLLGAVGSEADIAPLALELRHILLETEEEAGEVLAELQAGADFAALARERSLDLTARSNGGELGFFAREEMVAPFAEAVFGADVGAILGPVQTDFGYHVIEVLEHEDAYALRRIVVASEAEAGQALARLEAGEDFASLVDELSLLPENGGDLGYYSPETIPDAWRAAVFSAGVGDVVGPLQSADGYNILQITEAQLSRVRARHILVQTEAEARAALDRLAAGEDFAALVEELSIESGAQGNDGYLGFLTADQMPAPFAEAVHAAKVGDLVGPVETEYGYHVVEVLDSELTILAPAQMDEIKALHFQNWLRRQVRAVTLNDIWREAYPTDPQPGHIAPVLAEFEAMMDEALAALATPTAPPALN